jgi:hypothetical protein
LTLYVINSMGLCAPAESLDILIYQKIMSQGWISTDFVSCFRINERCKLLLDVGPPIRAYVEASSHLDHKNPRHDKGKRLDALGTSNLRREPLSKVNPNQAGVVLGKSRHPKRAALVLGGDQQARLA